VGHRKHDLWPFWLRLGIIHTEIDLARERSGFRARPCPLGAFISSHPARPRSFLPQSTNEWLSRHQAVRAKLNVVEGPHAYRSEWRRGTSGDLQCAVLENDDRPTAYALYRTNWAFGSRRTARRSTRANRRLPSGFGKINPDPEVASREGEFPPLPPSVRHRPGTAVPYFFRISPLKFVRPSHKLLIFLASPTGFEPVLPP
jgi:hypothetical protein